MGQRRTSARGHDPFWDLVAIARRLQAPGGCSWDRAQTISSLLPYLIEETWEVFETVRRRRRQGLEEELGDVLYTVLFMTLVAERHGWCRLDRLLQRTRHKMVRRHAHVFGPRRASTPGAAYRSWQASKAQERTAAPSPSKAFRQALVRAWDRSLAAYPRTRRRTSVRGCSKRPSARPARARARA
jgi:uncharacterized protein YabN with tetrapyrrole methylase and pyrophosphatase domain